VLRENPSVRATLGPLSARELEVLSMAADGLTNAQIASRMGVTIHAVKFHLASVYRKLLVANRTEAAALYFRTIAPPDQHAGVS
jgi:DNA-binding CsgD family transcriptional regulator